MKYLYFIGLLLLVGCYSNPYSREEQMADSLISSSAKIIVNKWGLKLVGTGAAMPGGPIRKLYLAFDAVDLTKDQMRLILIDAANVVVDEVNKNQEVQSYLFSPPFTVKNVQIAIFNRDKKGNEVYHPGIAVADIYGAKLGFKTIDAGNTLKYRDSFTETYSEALELLGTKANVLEN